MMMARSKVLMASSSVNFRDKAFDQPREPSFVLEDFFQCRTMTFDRGGRHKWFIAKGTSEDYT
jgi:hypothetical protein